MTFEEFFRKPYVERQLIIFDRNVSEPTTISVESVIHDLSARFQKEPVKYIALLVGGLVLPVPAGFIGAGMIGFVLREVLHKMKKITYMPLDHAHMLSLPKGRIKEGAIYIGHPIETQYKFYYPMHEFHLSLHKQKSSELIRILRSLQVTRLRIRHVEGYKESSDFSVEASAKVKNRQVGVGVGRKKESSSDYDVIFEATYPPSEEKPQLPENLIWYDYEDEWQLAVEEVLMGRMKTMNFKYSYKQDFGFNVDLKLSLDKAKIKAKTQNNEFQRTLWEVTIER